MTGGGKFMEIIYIFGEKHPERCYFLAYRYLNVWFFVQKIWQHMAYKTGDFEIFEILKFLPYGLMDLFFGEQMDGVPKPASLVTTGD